jgi:hypothetical protein
VCSIPESRAVSSAVLTGPLHDIRRRISGQQLESHEVLTKSHLLKLMNIFNVIRSFLFICRRYIVLIFFSVALLPFGPWPLF